MIEEAKDLIRDKIKQYNKAVVACSWGKDSLVVLHLVKAVADELDIKFDVLWNNTGTHYPSVYKIKKKLEKDWDLNVIETKAQKTVWEIHEEYGYPGVGSCKRSDRANNSCCYHIKKAPTIQAVKQNDWDLYFDGLTAYESDTRWLNLQEYGKFHFHEKFNLYKAHPIAYWTVDNVWDYIEDNDIPYPDVYDKEVDNYTKRGYSEYAMGHRFDRAIRNGCWACTLAVKVCPEKMKQLRVYYPKLWDKLMKSGLAKEIAKHKIGERGSLFDGYFNEDTQDDWLNNRPCFFDSI